MYYITLQLLTDIYYDTIIEFIPDPKNKQGCLNASGLKDYHINILVNIACYL